MNTIDRGGLWLVMTVLAGPAAAFAQSPTTAPAPLPSDNPCVSIIKFPVPAKLPDATSNAVVIVPREYVKESKGLGVGRRWPVLYLLHGYGGTHTRYWEKFSEVGRPLDALADRYGLILVTADGNRSSWYLDAYPELPDAKDWQYETIITRHLIPEVDRRFRTWNDRAGRGITGNSMGGHGALYLAARHPELFSACSSIAGVLSLRDVLNPQDLAKRLGPLETTRERWIEHSVLTQAEKFVGQSTAILFDCGWEDPFIHNTRALHLKLMNLKVPHDYTERPGGHTAEYWVNSLPYHLQFMADHLKPAGQATSRLDRSEKCLFAGGVQS
jgi:S-formylglutathione hydrolase FrmB